MPGLPMLPDTAPFPAEQITALNRIMSATNAGQRTWLSGFLAGYQAANAPQPAAAAPPARRAPLTILFATDGHMVILRGFLQSFRTMPLNVTFDLATFSQLLLKHEHD